MQAEVRWSYDVITKGSYDNTFLQIHLNLSWCGYDLDSGVFCLFVLFSSLNRFIKTEAVKLLLLHL